MYYLDSLTPVATELRNGNPTPTKPGARLAVEKHPSAVARWAKLKQLYLELRGASVGADRKPIPHTTNSDVMQLAAAWSRELAKVSPRSDQDRSEQARWKRCMESVKQHADMSKPDAVYPDNESFWQDCSSRLAIYLESRKAVPSKWALLNSSFAGTLQAVPGALGDATLATAGTIADAGGAMVDFVKKPVNAALVVLGGAILLPPVIRAVRK